MDTRDMVPPSLANTVCGLFHLDPKDMALWLAPMSACAERCKDLSAAESPDTRACAECPRDMVCGLYHLDPRDNIP